MLLYRLASRLLAARPDAERRAVWVASLWFASVVAVRHTQNCLETGLYVLVVLVFALRYLEWVSSGLEARPLAVPRSMAGLLILLLLNAEIRARP